ncbi:MAG: hypothetical protein AAF512_11545 [Pseudomonadota bacterium]
MKSRLFIFCALISSALLMNTASAESELRKTWKSAKKAFERGFASAHQHYKSENFNLSDEVTKEEFKKLGLKADKGAAEDYISWGKKLGPNLDKWVDELKEFNEKYTDDSSKTGKDYEKDFKNLKKAADNVDKSCDKYTTGFKKIKKISYIKIAPLVKKLIATKESVCETVEKQAKAVLD